MLWEKLLNKNPVGNTAKRLPLKNTFSKCSSKNWRGKLLAKMFLKIGSGERSLHASSLKSFCMKMLSKTLPKFPIQRRTMSRCWSKEADRKPNPNIANNLVLKKDSVEMFSSMLAKVPLKVFLWEMERMGMLVESLSFKNAVRNTVRLPISKNGLIEMFVSKKIPETVPQNFHWGRPYQCSGQKTTVQIFERTSAKKLIKLRPCWNTRKKTTVQRRCPKQCQEYAGGKQQVEMLVGKLLSKNFVQNNPKKAFSRKKYFIARVFK